MQDGAWLHAQLSFYIAMVMFYFTVLMRSLRHDSTLRRPVRERIASAWVSVRSCLGSSLRLEQTASGSWSCPRERCVQERKLEQKIMGVKHAIRTLLQIMAVVNCYQIWVLLSNPERNMALDRSQQVAILVLGFVVFIADLSSSHLNKRMLGVWGVLLLFLCVMATISPKAISRATLTMASLALVPMRVFAVLISRNLGMVLVDAALASCLCAAYAMSAEVESEAPSAFEFGLPQLGTWAIVVLLSFELDTHAAAVASGDVDRDILKEQRGAFQLLLCSAYDVVVEIDHDARVRSQLVGQWEDILSQSEDFIHTDQDIRESVHVYDKDTFEVFLGAAFKGSRETAMPESQRIRLQGTSSMTEVVMFGTVYHDMDCQERLLLALKRVTAKSEAGEQREAVFSQEAQSARGAQETSEANSAKEASVRDFPCGASRAASVLDCSQAMTIEFGADYEGENLGAWCVGKGDFTSWLKHKLNEYRGGSEARSHEYGKLLVRPDHLLPAEPPVVADCTVKFSRGIGKPPTSKVHARIMLTYPGGAQGVRKVASSSDGADGGSSAVTSSDSHLAGSWIGVRNMSPLDAGSVESSGEDTVSETLSSASATIEESPAGEFCFPTAPGRVRKHRTSRGKRSGAVSRSRGEGYEHFIVSALSRFQQASDMQSHSQSEEVSGEADARPNRPSGPETDAAQFSL